MKTQQQSDGGFEVAGFPGFETPDAIEAIAENAEKQATWNTSQALAAVNATVSHGHSPLHYMDNYVDAGVNAGQAAKVIVLVVKPLGLNPADFDPDHDGGHVNLRNIVVSGKKSDGTYGTFNDTLYAMIALHSMGVVIAPATLSAVRKGQEASGGWDFAGSPSATDADVDTTSVAIEALVADGVKPTDPTLHTGPRLPRRAVPRHHRRVAVVRRQRSQLDRERRAGHHRVGLRPGQPLLARQGGAVAGEPGVPLTARLVAFAAGVERSA